MEQWNLGLLQKWTSDVLKLVTREVPLVPLPIWQNIVLPFCTVDNKIRNEHGTKRFSSTGKINYGGRMKKDSEGAFNVSYHITDSEDKVVFVLKKWKHTYEQIPDEYFKMARFIKTPHVIKHIDFFFDDQNFGVSVPLCSLVPFYKDSLEKKIVEAKRINSLTGKGRCADELKIAEWFWELTEGVQALHQCRITHCDLNPANIFLDDGHIVIGDIGETNAGTFIKTFQGRFAYLPKEVSGGDSPPLNADMFSLGCILLDMLSLELTDLRQENIPWRIAAIPRDYSKVFTQLVLGLLIDDRKRRLTIDQVRSLLQDHLPCMVRFVSFQ